MSDKTSAVIHKYRHNGTINMKWALLLLLAGCSIPQAPAATSKDYVHRIGTLDGGVCGATAMGKHVLLTASHCLPDDAKLIVLNGTAVAIQRIERDGSDHALVVVTATFKHYAKRVGRPRQGQKVHWYGNPAGWADMYRTGTVSGYLPDGKGVLDANGYYGDSGSGLFNSRGELVGVVSAIAGHGIFKMTVTYPFRYTAEQWTTVQ